MKLKSVPAQQYFCKNSQVILRCSQNKTDENKTKHPQCSGKPSSFLKSWGALHSASPVPCALCWGSHCSDGERHPLQQLSEPEPGSPTVHPSPDGFLFVSGTQGYLSIF